jgi:acyl carrier protein
MASQGLENAESIEQIKETIKAEVLISGLGLEDITVEDIDDDMPLFDGGLGLDSVEAVQILVSLEQLYGIGFDGVSVERQIEIFQSVGQLAQFVYDHGANRS